MNALLANQPAREPALHPNLAEVYREKVAALHTALADGPTHPGFLCEAHALNGATDITSHGGGRQFRASLPPPST